MSSTSRHLQRDVKRFFSMSNEITQKLRIIIQFQPAGRFYTLIAHAENRTLRPVRFNSLEELTRRFVAAGIAAERHTKPDRPSSEELTRRFVAAGIAAERQPKPDRPSSEETILYAEDLHLSQTQ